MLNQPRIWNAMKTKGALKETTMRAAGLKYGSQPCDTPIMLTMRNATITSHTRKVRLLIQRG